jgi:hypothetical protein
MHLGYLDSLFVEKKTGSDTFTSLGGKNQQINNLLIVVLISAYFLI